MMTSDKKIYVAGHEGLVGSAILRRLISMGFTNIVTRTRSDLDLTQQGSVLKFFSDVKPDYVVLAAAKVGGIHANNTYPAEFIYNNMMIEANAIHSAYLSGVERLLFLGSTCIYPKHAPQPMTEDVLLTGPLEETNEPYAIAKIAGIKLCESYNRQYQTDFRSIMPTNLYGINDNFHPENSHVIPALIRRFHTAKMNGDSKVVVWGSGKAMREFLFVDDMADASLYILGLTKEKYRTATEKMLSHINVGTGVDVTVRELAEAIKRIVGFSGEILFDATKPDGAPRKLVEISRIKALGWRPKTDIESGLRKTYEWYCSQHVHRKV